MADTREIVFGPDPVFDAALETLRIGGPGLSDDTRKVMARAITMKVRRILNAPLEPTQ